MKLACISDIHGNLQALQAILADIEAQGADELVVLGDVASLGPNPREVIDTLQNRQARFIRGNHDDLLIALYDDPAAPDRHGVYRWAANLLTHEHIAFLKSFEDDISWQIGNNVTLLCCHAVPGNNDFPIRDLLDSDAGRILLENHAADVFVVGHEHQQFTRKQGRKTVVSVGSAGFPYRQVPFTGFPGANPWGEYALLTCRNGATQVEFRKTDYDMAAFRNAALRSDNPIKDWCLGIAPRCLDKE